MLLLLFAAGALIGTMYRGRAADLLQFLPGSAFGCFVLILALDACMIGSLLAWLMFPAITLVFGAAAAVEASEILTIGPNAAWRRYLLLAAITPLHFLLSAWSLRTAGRVRRSLRGREHEGRIYLTAFLLLIFAYLACVSMVYFRLQAQL